jgi:formate dehydrogenase subunit gamma
LNSISNRETSTLASALSRFQSVPGGLLPLLHAVQEDLGYIPPSATQTIASAFNLSRAEVHGVITYYHHFRQSPPAKHNLAICHAEACQARGCRSVINKADALLGGTRDSHDATHSHESTNDWHVEATYCLGLCATGPALMLDGKLHAHVTPAKLEALIARANAKDAS